MQTEIQDELMQAQFLANKTAALGSDPTTEPRPVPPADNAKSMLEAILAAELQAGRDDEERAEQADEYGDMGLPVQLEAMARDETGLAEETR